MSGNLGQPKKYGSRVYDAAGNVTALHGKLEVGDRVVWLGRKHGSGSHDAKFEVGQSYPVCFIYPNNGDIELQGSEPQITIRAGEEEYRAQTGIQ